MRHPVNTQSRTERALLGRLAEILPEDHVLKWLANAPLGFDAALVLAGEGRPPMTLFIECKQSLSPATFQAWEQPRRAMATEHQGLPVLGLPVVSPRVAQLCVAHGWSWFDLAGNCRISVPGQLHIERSGIPPVRRPSRRPARLGSVAAARVLRVLLSPESAGRTWTQRELQAGTACPSQGESGVSLGLVNKIVRHLVDEGYVAGDRGLRVRDPSGLLAAWRQEYRFDRHERLDWFTLLKGPALAQALFEVAGDTRSLLYAAFSAAERQAPHVRQPKVWIYARPGLVDGLMHRTESKPADSGENLVVFVADDAGVFVPVDASVSVAASEIACTDPVQTYLDLFHCGGRGEEAAQAVLEQRILPAWKEAGIG